MRLELIFEIEQLELPKDNKSIWISFFKKCLTRCGNGQFYDRYFGGTKQKDYTFSVIMPNPRFADEKILLDGHQIKLLFSSDDGNKTGLIFYQAFISAKQKRFPLPEGNGLVLKRINQMREKLITSSRVMFRTVVGSGLVIREHNKETNRDKFFTFMDEGFENQFKQVLGMQAEEAGFPADAGRNLIFKAVQCKKILVKQYGIYVDATIGIFEVEGDVDFLQYLYQAGMGSKHSMGYGMLDIVAQKM